MQFQYSGNPWKRLLFGGLGRFAGVFVAHFEPGAERVAKGARTGHMDLGSAASSLGRDRRDDAELRTLLEPPFGLRGRTKTAGEADLPERRDPLAHRRTTCGRGDRERDREVGARLVDPEAACDVDEDVGGAECDAGVALEHGDDHREALRVDSRADATGHREV
jgi:hypothetical protein